MAMNEALFGLHDVEVSRSFARLVQRHFLAQPVSNVEEMLRSCQSTSYGLYVMDLNLGQAGALIIAPAQAIYQELQRQRIEGLEQRFIGVSGEQGVIDLALAQGIPAVLKPDFPTYFNTLFP